MSLMRKWISGSNSSNGDRLTQSNNGSTSSPSKSPPLVLTSVPVSSRNPNQYSLKSKEPIDTIKNPNSTSNNTAPTFIHKTNADGSQTAFPFLNNLHSIISDDNMTLKFGNGDNKIFGMENFGNTCYCNSILQCLYYTRAFRESVLMYPQVSSVAKKTVPGLQRHNFLVKYEQQIQQLQKQNEKDSLNTASNGVPKSSANASTNNTSTNNASTNNVTTNGTNGSGSSTSGTLNSRMKSMRRSSFFSKKNDSSSDDLNKSNNSNSISNGKSNNNNNSQTLVSSNNGNDDKNQPKSHSTTIVGVNEENNSAESKKKMALFRGPIINLDHSLSQTYNMENNMFSSLKDIFESMVESDSTIGVVSPLNLVNTLKEENELFRSTMHQDAHEFLNFLINNVIETIDSQNGKKNMNNDNVRNEGLTNSTNNWCNDIFQGLIRNETKCLSCENVTSKDEAFLDLSIDLEKYSSLSNCLDNFSKSEILNHENKFFCDCCNSLQEATKRMRLKKLPRVLSLHLKRFKYNETLQKNIKLFNHISYPLYLRLFNTIEEVDNPDKLYELYGVVVHIGGGPSHGHYISLCKTNSGWLLFDDETVEKIDESYVLKFFGDGPGLSSAYVLFYQETTDDELISKITFNNSVEDLSQPHVDTNNYEPFDSTHRESINTDTFNLSNKSNSTINLRKQSDISTISNNSLLPNSISTVNDEVSSKNCTTSSANLTNSIIDENPSISYTEGEECFANSFNSSSKTTNLVRNKSQTSKAASSHGVNGISSPLDSNNSGTISNKSSFTLLKRRESKFWPNGKNKTKDKGEKESDKEVTKEKEKEREKDKTREFEFERDEKDKRDMERAKNNERINNNNDNSTTNNNEEKKKSRFGFGFKKLKD